MKTKFSNTRDCIHTFAQRTQTNGRASSVFFERTDKLYSYGYHYLLAEFKEIDGQTCIIINDKGYSVTTSKHISYTTQATRQYKQYFFRDIDLHHVCSEIEALQKKIFKARKPEIYISQIQSKMSAFLAYPPNNTKEIKQSLHFKTMAKIAKSVASPELLNKAKERAAKLAKIQAAKKLELLNYRIRKFYAYELDSVQGDEDYLRLSIDGLSVETSQGVCVDISEAAQLYKYIIEGRDIKGYKIGRYVVTSINGVLQIGCHRINIESMHRIGKMISK